MKKILSYIILLLPFLQGACAQAPAQRPKILNPDFDKKITQYLNFSVPVISPEQLHSMSENVYILDAREPHEYEVSHIPNARLVGYDDFDIQQLSDIPKQAPVVVYCSIGYRSEKIGERLQKAGFTNVSNLYGSIFEWTNQAYPLVNAAEQPTRKVHTYSKKWSRWVDDSKADKVW